MLFCTYCRNRFSNFGSNKVGAETYVINSDTLCGYSSRCSTSKGKGSTWRHRNTASACPIAEVICLLRWSRPLPWIKFSINSLKEKIFVTKPCICAYIPWNFAKPVVHSYANWRFLKYNINQTGMHLRCSIKPDQLSMLSSPDSYAIKFVLLCPVRLINSQPKLVSILCF